MCLTTGVHFCVGTLRLRRRLTPALDITYDISVDSSYGLVDTLN